MLSDEEILDHAEQERDPQALCRSLVDTANERGGVDNITVVIVRVPDGTTSSRSAPSIRP
jgi:serine/threonine protein phosphatase PrpC